MSEWSLGDRDTPIAAFSRAVSACPDRVFLDFSGSISTYREVDTLTTRFAHALVDLGVTVGDRVATILNNNLDAVVAWLAINKLRAVSVPLNTALRGEFLRHQVATAGPAIVVTEAEYVDRLAAVAEGLPDVELILHRGELDVVPDCSIRTTRLDDHRGEDESPIEQLPEPTDLACLIYTSGTTGPSKACMVGFNYMCNLAWLKLRGAPATADDITLTPLPLYHQNAIVSGITTTMLLQGRIAFVPRFSVSQFCPRLSVPGQPSRPSSDQWEPCSHRLRPMTRWGVATVSSTRSVVTRSIGS